jgi:hypothetical protein
MDATLMLKTFAAVSAISAVKAPNVYRRAEILLTARRGDLVQLLALVNGMTVSEVREADAAQAFSALVNWAVEGGVSYIRVVSSCGPEIVCTTLYQYRPEDVHALCYLLRRRRKDDRRTEYIADTLRLLVLSKMKKGSEFPHLAECLGEKKKSPEKTGAQILDGIISAALGKGEKEK